MSMRIALASVCLLVASGGRAQDMPFSHETQNVRVPPVPFADASPPQERLSPSKPTSAPLGSTSGARPLPDKPQPVAREGQWIGNGEQLPHFSDDLVMVARKNDGRLMWHVEEVNSCAWCGTPMTWGQAMFDRKASSMWALRSALFIADIEITHRMPCFRAGTCKEWNPLLGQTRLQGYSVGVGMTAFAWVADGWVRKGSRKYRIGGYRHWWIVPSVGYAASAVGIISNLARWHDR
jgi:hypothetical protein